ncbi:unnamed protein product [Rotaria socialis]|uniref:Reverse transcriptase domain-containing protein n=4 Tax=Rotaria TaxID=231623 RepID=A0A820XDV2_9BILA|nr:unnamed protein product [Rotaria socialis]CAF4528426.1 unnamed protein product [Rotaria socialis]
MAEKNKDKQSTVNENINWNTVEDFNDMFDIVDDENDTIEYAEDELNKYYLSGHVNSMVQEDEMIDDDSYDNDINVIEEIQTEAILSQNFSQLSTKAEDEQKSGVINKRQRSSTTISSPDASCKKIKLIVDDADESTATTTMSSTETNEIPIYLSINNKLFVHMAQTITKTTTSISINSIQQLALFIHQAASVRTDREVMKAYLHSVMGTLKQSESHLIEVDRRVWPIHVQSLMLTQHKAATTTACASVTEDQQADCEKHLHQRLIEMNEKIQYHQNQFNEKKNNLIDFTSNIEQTIRSFVQKHGVKPLEMKRNLRIAMTNHDYDSEILRRQYLQEKPNEYQIQVMKHLSEKKRELEKSKRELLEMKYRVFYNKPHSSLDAIETTMPILNDDDRKLKLLNKHEKLIQRKKLDFVAIKIIGAEIKFYQYLRAFDHELAAMWKNHRELVKNKGMSTTLTDLIEKRFTGITDRWRDVYNYRLNCYFRNFYSDFEPTNTNADGDKMKRIGFSSSLIIDAIHQLSDKELQLLNRGPSYVPPGQISISSSGQSVDDIIKKKYAPLKHQLSCLFSKYHVNIALSMEIEQKISDQFTDLFSVPIPSNLQQRALYEKHLLQSIRYSLNANNLILRRTADNMNTFYLGNLQEFETKAYDYLSKSDAYKALLNKDKDNGGQQWQTELNQMVESMNLLLESLKNHKAVNIDLFNRLLVDASKVKLPYLYFLPDVSKENEISLVPYITSKHSATWRIGKYLNELLRPFVDKNLSTTTFRDEPDFMRKLNDYVYVERHLRATTLFCTIKIINYYTLDIHKNMIDTVGYFLEDNLVTNKLEQVTIQTIKNLLHIFLYNNVFYYKDKIYTLMKGSPNTMPLSDTLSNIFLFTWQKKILKEIKSKNEFFGRYKDQIFFTWNNGNEEQLGSFLQTIRDKKPNVQFQKLIGTNVPFLNAFVENQNGELFTRVYHHPILPRYTLPYVVGHSKLAHGDWFRSALIRAVCYCSLIEDFTLERIYLELTCLANGYSIFFVENNVQHFFSYFHADTMRYLKDQTMYDKFRHDWFGYMTMQYELSDKLQTFNDNDCLIHLNYLYEFGPKCQFNQQFHCLWTESFNQHANLSKDKVKIQLTTKHQHSLNSLLAREKSTCSIQ